MASNPIEQRIELLAEQWEKYKNTEASIICFRCQPDEVDMIDTFYTYMIAADTPVYDIAFHFDSICHDVRTFSKALLNELTEIINIWNHSKKDDRIDFKALQKRPKWWKKTKTHLAKNTPKDANGNYLDAKTGLPITGEIAIGHQGETWREYQDNPANHGKTRAQVCKDYNDINNLGYEDSSTNSSNGAKTKGLEN